MGIGDGVKVVTDCGPCGYSLIEIVCCDTKLETLEKLIFFKLNQTEY